MMATRNIGLIGCGEIARKQHARFLLSGENDTGLHLVATADPCGPLPGFAGRHYTDHRAMLAAEPSVAAVSVASPTATHFAVARDALLAGRHVLLEKPPTTTLGELLDLRRIAAEQKVVLVTSFHARHNATVGQLREILLGRHPPEHIGIEWREDFERWHAGQAWPWLPGGFGVFDPGINALSVLCHVLPDLKFRVERARFYIPARAATPALVEMDLAWDSGTGNVAFEWRKGGVDVWDISVRGADETDRTGTLVLRGVRTLLRDGIVVLSTKEDKEYAGVYRDFAHAVGSGLSCTSVSEMRIIEDAMLTAEVEQSETPF